MLAPCPAHRVNHTRPASGKPNRLTPVRSCSRLISRYGATSRRLTDVSREAKPFVFELEEPEIQQITETEVNGQGGLQELQKRLKAQLEKGPSVTFTDAEFGQLVRYMTRYGGGGFEARLHRAFSRSIYDLLSARMVL